MVFAELSFLCLHALQVLILLPMRNAALRVVSCLVQLAQKENRSDSVLHKQRFLREFGPQVRGCCCNQAGTRSCLDVCCPASTMCLIQEGFTGVPCSQTAVKAEQAAAAQAGTC